VAYQGLYTGVYNVLIINTHHKEFAHRQWDELCCTVDNWQSRLKTEVAQFSCYIVSPIYKLWQPVERTVLFVQHSCQIGCQTGLYNRFHNGVERTVLSNLLSNPFDNRLYRVDKQSTGCQMCLTTGVTTGWMFVYTIQPVFKPVVQPDWQPVVSCKRGLRLPAVDKPRLVTRHTVLLRINTHTTTQKSNRPSFANNSFTLISYSKTSLTPK